MPGSRRPWLSTAALAAVTVAGAAGLLAGERAGAERPPPVDVIDLSEPSTPASSAGPSAGASSSPAGVQQTPPTPLASPQGTERSGDPARLVRPVPAPAGPRGDGPDADHDAVGDDADDVAEPDDDATGGGNGEDDAPDGGGSDDGDDD